MKILLDMNLSPKWVEVLETAGWEAVHWYQIGAPDALDQEIFDYALSNNYVVFTNDLDFGAILVARNAQYPSVIQVRTQDVAPENMAQTVIPALRQLEKYLEEGALIVIDESKWRARILPLPR